MKNMSKTYRYEKPESLEAAFTVSVSEGRGIGSGGVMPRTNHLLDRAIRYIPWEAARDGRDHGRKSEKRAQKRRNRQTNRAICNEWPLDG